MTDDLPGVKPRGKSGTPQPVACEGKRSVQSEGRFHVTMPRCAQKCAHSIAAKPAYRIEELVVDVSLRAKAAVFQKVPSKIRFHERNSPDRQVLVPGILTGAR